MLLQPARQREASALEHFLEAGSGPTSEGSLHICSAHIGKLATAVALDLVPNGSGRRWVVWVAARHADHTSAAGAVRHKVKGDRDGEFAYVRDACVERALTCRSRSVLPRMLTRTCFALPGRLQEHPNDYSDQLLHPTARLGAQGAALKAVFKKRDRVRWTPPITTLCYPNLTEFWLPEH